MKKKCIMALIIGAAFLAQGCGYEEGTDAVVTVVDSTPQTEQQRQQIPQHRQQLRSRPQAALTYRHRMLLTMQWRV